MESKQLNKIVFLMALAFSMNIFSQMKMIDINGKKLTFNLKKEKQDIIKISENDAYTIFYIIDRNAFDFDEGLGTATLANVIFFSKKYNKGILATFEQGVEHGENSVYDIKLDTGYDSNHMFISSMIIVDKDFNYEYLMNYLYIHLPHDRNVFMNRLTIQNIKNYCNLTRIDIKGSAIYENIDDILSNISKINTNQNKSKECDPIISTEDLKYFFPERIDKDGHVYYKKQDQYPLN